MRVLALVIISGWLVLLSAAILLAHEWYGGFCCNDRDCAPVPVQTVSRVDGGYLFTLRAGQHPLVSEDTEVFVPFDHRYILPSQDANYHLCITSSAAWQGEQNTTVKRTKARCVYVPPSM